MLRTSKLFLGTCIALSASATCCLAGADQSDLVAHVTYLGPPGGKPQALAVLQQLAATCPQMATAADQADQIDLWEGEPAPYRRQRYKWAQEIWVEFDVPKSVLSTLPADYQNPWVSDHVFVRAGTKGRPGFEMNAPIAKWLCGLPVDPVQLSGHYDANRDWNVFIGAPQLASLTSAAKSQ